VDLDVGIKTALNSSNPQISRCVSQLDELATLEVQPLMLKKQPDIVTTVRKLRKYVGPLDLTGYSQAERGEISRGVKQITDRASFSYLHFIKLFKSFDLSSKGDKLFPEHFEEVLEKFRKQTKDWDESKLLCLTDELEEAL